jgi:tetratricopeptide (TPR) repeat protein
MESPAVRASPASLGNPAKAVHLGIASALAFLVAATFFPVHAFPFVSFDDPQNVLQEPHIVGGLTGSNLRWTLTAFKLGIWAPLTQITFLCDGTFLALKPGPMHVENVVLHLLGAWTLYAMLAFSTGAIGRSAVVAALFAIHPMHVESVAWITERRDVLGAPLLFGAMFFYCRYVRAGGAGSAAGWYTAALAAYGLSLTAKATGITAPLILLLLDYWPLHRKRGDLGQILLEKIPFVCLAVPVAVIAVHGQQDAGAMASVIGIPLPLRLGNTVVSCVEYLAKLTVPTGLCVLYPFPVDGRPAGQVAAAAVLLLLIAALALKLRQKRPFLIVGFAWFLIVLAPVSGITQAGLQSMADRYSYVPAVGFFIMVAWGGFDLATWLLGRRLGATRLAGVTAVIVLGVLAVMARVQLEYWRDTRALYTRAVAVTDNNWSLQYHLGLLDAQEGDYSSAAGLFLQVIAEKPYFPDVYIDYGNCLYLTSPARAIAAYDRAVELNPADPRALINRSNAKRATGDLDGARADLAAAARLDPAAAVPRR